MTIVWYSWEKNIVFKSNVKFIWRSTILERPVHDVLFCDRERASEWKIEREQRVWARLLKTRRGYVTALAARSSPTTFLYGKDGSEIATTRIWVSMHCGATLLTQSAAPRCRRIASSRETAEAAFTLTKIDTLSDQLLSSQLRSTRRITPCRLNCSSLPQCCPSLPHPIISHESLEMESLSPN